MHDEEFLIFHGLETFHEAKWTLHGPGVRADAQWNLTWLEELASESNTIQAQKELSWQGRLQANTRRKYMYDLVGFASIFQD